MKEMEERIYGMFPKALCYMEEENAFWDAYAKWTDAGNRLVEARREAYATCLKLVSRKSDNEYKEDGDIEVKVNAAKNAFDAATLEYEAARQKLLSVPKDVLKDKVGLAKANAYLAESEYFDYESVVSIAKISNILGNNEDALQSFNNVSAMRDAAKLELERRKERCKALGFLGEG